MTWHWEYHPEELADGVSEAFLVQVRERADELVRAASTMYGDGALYEGSSPKGQVARVPMGMFAHLIVVRSECVYVRQLTMNPFFES
ncbi:hypothetical protein [Yinghuangia seranimata]|uniref:hypothetical protein n=1 Tax=Yinghuangia seranimata TaxID=408067 RepID=UPI00248AD763|nr:hypothetical protein [Yinghuangia seranimata]MDI2129568.1 hypothetical protein [Yinghuangia seranimata]